VRGEIGSGERRVRELFAEAKRSSLSIIFIDEFHAVFTSREEGVVIASDVGATLTATLSGCFDDLSIWNRYSGLESLVTVIASTNEPWTLDRSFLRSQRLERCLFVEPLSAEGRVEFFTAHAAGHDELSGRQISSLVSRTEMFTGADLTRGLHFEDEDAFLLDGQTGRHIEGTTTTTKIDNQHILLITHPSCQDRRR
jgi:SpoVK/Ycf46/Vps4 family AAA+-type ATPase